MYLSSCLSWRRSTLARPQFTGSHLAAHTPNFFRPKPTFISHINSERRDSFIRSDGASSSNPAQKINVDNKARFRYPGWYWFRLIDVSLCCAALSRRSSTRRVVVPPPRDEAWRAKSEDETDTRFTVFDWSASKKQLLIFYTKRRRFNALSSIWKMLGALEPIRLPGSIWFTDCFSDHSYAHCDV